MPRGWTAINRLNSNDCVILVGRQPVRRDDDELLSANRHRNRAECYSTVCPADR